MITPKKIARAVWHMARFERHLKNGVQFWLCHRFGRPMPSLKFRNGQVWHHGAHDSPFMLFSEIYMDRYYEPLNAPPKALVLDIGANIGAVTMFWALKRPDIFFHVYEPNPQCLPALLRNMQWNGLAPQVKLYREAISGSRESVELWVDVPTVLSTSYGTAPAENGRKIQVTAITLDEAWERTSRAPIWMLKIDVEGAEGDILEAASDEMLAQVHSACIEWHDNIVPGVRNRCIARLKSAGFTWRERVHPWNEGIIFAHR